MSFKQELDEVCDWCPKQSDYYGCAKMQKEGDCPLFSDEGHDEDAYMESRDFSEFYPEAER